MRTNNYLWAMLAAATLTLTGCGSDENGIAEPQLQEKDGTTGTAPYG